MKAAKVFYSKRKENQGIILHHLMFMNVVSKDVKKNFMIKVLYISTKLFMAINYLYAKIAVKNFWIILN